MPIKQSIIERMELNAEDIKHSHTILYKRKGLYGRITCSLATEYENLHEIVLSTFEKFMIFENLLAGSSNIPLSSMLRIEKILYRQHFLYKRFVRNLCLLILRLWHFHDFHLQALQIKHLHLHLHFSLPSHQQFQSSEIGKRHLYLFP